LGVRILGEPDAENRKYTMAFVSGELGPVGRLDLIYGGQYVSPAGVKYGVYPDGEGVEKREALMKEIYDKARGMFRCGMYWQASYYREGEEIGTLEFIDEYSRRARNTACHRAPPGCDMIRLLMPKGAVMVKTDMGESGKWEKEKTKKAKKPVSLDAVD
jgi:hypothetical protein